MYNSIMNIFSTYLPTKTMSDAAQINRMIKQFKNMGILSSKTRIHIQSHLRHASHVAVWIHNVND